MDVVFAALDLVDLTARSRVRRYMHFSIAQFIVKNCCGQLCCSFVMQACSGHGACHHQDRMSTGEWQCYCEPGWYGDACDASGGWYSTWPYMPVGGLIAGIVLAVLFVVRERAKASPLFLSWHSQ